VTACSCRTLRASGYGALGIRRPEAGRHLQRARRRRAAAALQRPTGARPLGCTCNHRTTLNARLGMRHTYLRQAKPQCESDWRIGRPGACMELWGGTQPDRLVR
jgi:hypothetical protein